jgi:TatD DNase family protein
MPDFIDIHSHLNFSNYDNDREEIIQKLKENNIWTITVGTELKTSKEAVALADTHENLYATIGLHPTHILEEKDNPEFFDEKVYEQLVKNPKVLALGECGLDYAFMSPRPGSSVPNNIEVIKKQQKADFEKQIEFAVKYNKPLMIHCRDAYADCLDILKSKQKEYGEKVRGNFHFFTSPIEIAKECLEIGFTVSFTGPITFVSKYEDIVRYVPLERMMAETDAPFASPTPYRGKRNEPFYVKEIVKKIAEIKKEPFDKVQKQMVQNAFELFFKENS